MTLTTDAAPPGGPAGLKPLRYGLVIEWPVPSRTPPLPVTFAEVCVHEIGPDGTERCLPAVTGLTLHVTPDGVTADVETLLAEDGEPFAHEGSRACPRREREDRQGRRSRGRRPPVRGRRDAGQRHVDAPPALVPAAGRGRERRLGMAGARTAGEATAPQEVPTGAGDPGPPYRGLVIIEWPPPVGGSVYACMPGRGCQGH